MASQRGVLALARDIRRSAGKLNLSTVGPTSAQLVWNEIDNAEQALMFEQLARAMADHDPREAAAKEDGPSSRQGRRRS